MWSDTQSCGRKPNWPSRTRVFVTSPEWITLRTKVVRTLAPFPDARQAVMAALAEGSDYAA